MIHFQFNLISLHLQQKTKKRSSKVRYVFYVLGILILTLGIYFTIQSDLGASLFDSLLVGLAINAGLLWEVGK